MPHLFCLGEALIEFNQQPGSDLYRQGFGGDTSNTAVAAARLGVSVGYISCIGDDWSGSKLIELWNQENVSIDTVTRDRDSATGLYVVTHDDRGHHFQYHRRGSAASRMTARTVSLDAIRSAKILHLSAISQAISTAACDTCFAAIDIAKSAGVRFCYDSNLRLALWPLERAREIILKTIQLADIFRPSFDDARTLTGLSDPNDIVDYFLTLGPRLVAMTLGDAGTIIATPERRHSLVGYRVAAIDATGAGDAFNGAFLSRLLAGDDAFNAAAFANAAAALATTGYGAVPPLPRLEAVRALMAEQPVNW